MSAAAPALLRLLDALFRAETAPAGLRGTVAIGVTAGGTETWWLAVLDPEPRAAFVPLRPQGAHARLLVGAEEAEDLARGRRARGEQIYADGDRTLLHAFIERFVRPLGVGAVLQQQAAARRS